jgi:PAS domain S-box-containing protein
MVFKESDIRRAFDEDEFYPVFQPLVELRTGQLAGFEALARWRHKVQGAIMPDDFIPSVENTGFIDRLTRVLLEKAFSSPVFKDTALPLSLSINVSSPQLLGSNLAKRIGDVARPARFPLDRITIEITETALVDDLDRARAVANELKALHCKLALDDFGTGYSSLKHLHALPFDEIKVDKSFVSSMTEKRESRKIVAAVVALGQSLGLRTVAEGVEKQDQANMLLWLGCDLGQGWLFGKPAPISTLPLMIADKRRYLPVAVPAPLNEDSVMSFEALPADRLAQLQAIYDGAPVGLCFLDRKMRYVSLNKRLAELNGVPLLAHLGRTVAEVIPQVFPKVEPYIRRALQGEPVYGVEVHKPPLEEGGETLTHLLSYQPARDEGGELLGVSVAITDITRTKRTEAALRESEDHFRSMMKLHPHVPWVVNTKGEVTEGGPRWEALTGQPISEALGRGWLKMLHPDDIEHTKQAIRHSLATGDPIDIEYRIRRPNGEWTRMRSRGAPRFGPSGKIICIYGVVEEVHSHDEETEALRACKAKLHAALDAVPIGVILADAHDCKIFRVNPEALRITQGKAFPGQTVNEYSRLGVTNPDGRPLRPEEYPLVRAMVRGETTEARHLVFPRPDGTQIHLSVSAKPIFDEEGELIGGVLVLREFDPES